jgi:hypothetical protein
MTGPGKLWYIIVSHGTVDIGWSHTPRGGPPPKWAWGRDKFALDWSPGYWIYRAPVRTVSVSLWMLFLLVALPTAYLWYRDRRRFPRGHCQLCGYDLTGNVSGVCPECGAKA